MMLAFLPLFVPFGASTDTGTIVGRVTDQAGIPIQSAQVFVVGHAWSALTDRQGDYRITGVAEGTYSLRAAFIGYKKSEVQLVKVVAGDTTTQDIALEKSTVSLDSLVVSAAENPVSIRGGRVGTNGFEEVSVVVQGMSGVPVDNAEEYHFIRENGFKVASVDPLSTFAIDVDAASYANVRRFLTKGERPPADAVRIEELINYFPYDYEAPRGTEPFSVTTAQMPAPWAPAHRLVMVGMQSRRIDAQQLPPGNLVFLLDVSGSMDDPDKLPLVKRAFRLLVDQLRPQDRVAIVVYAGAAGLVLPSTAGADKTAILGALDSLEAGGSTAGGAGIQLAYQVAKENFIPGGNNRVILATDGDFNVGISSEGDLVRLIEQRKRDGIFLTVLGFGAGNLKDSRMEALADRGNGNYAYVDDIFEARKVFVQELGATLVTIARDVKIQVEFNPALVSEYRLIGYENRMLEHQDFNDDTKDGGELGAGHSVTAIYEVVPVGVVRSPLNTVDPLKYQPLGNRPTPGNELATVKLRYQPPAGGRSRLLSVVVTSDPQARGTRSLRFAAAVAEFGLLLRNSEYKRNSSWESVLALAGDNLGRDPGGYRAEFVRLAEVARGIGPAGEEVGARDDE